MPITSARPPKSANIAGSAPVMNTWPGKRVQRVEQAGAAARVEMGGDLVEQDQRRDPAHRPHQPGMGQHEADQQRLLLAGRGGRRRHVLGAVAHDEVAGLRPRQGAPGRTVPRAAAREGEAEAILRLDRRPDRDEVVEVAFEPQRRPRERLRVVARLVDQPIQAFRGLAAGKSHGDPEFGDLALDRIEPAAVVRTLLEQAVARAERPLHRRDAGAVAGIDREHEPIEEAAAVAARPAKQAVEVRSQPDHAQEFREGDRRGRAGPVDPAQPADAAVEARRLASGAEAMLAAVACQGQGDGEASGTLLARHRGEFGPAQAPAGGEQGDGFEDVGLAGPVLAHERDEARRQRQVEVGVVAEVAGGQAGEALGTLLRLQADVSFKPCHKRSVSDFRVPEGHPEPYSAGIST